MAEIVRILYDEVKRLESILLPNHVESLYEPLEELTTCIYFQRSIEELSCDDIKVTMLILASLSAIFIDVVALSLSFTGILQHFLVFSIAIFHTILPHRLL